MIWISLLIIVFLLILWFTKKSKQEEPTQDKNIVLPYKKRDDFLSTTELSFYNTLKTFIQNKAVICPKVAVKEVVFIGKGVGRDYMKYFNWIAKKHVDFILCDEKTMQVVCAVELDDKSHNRQDRQQRDEFVNRVFETAKIPLFHIPAKSGYSAGDFGSILDCLSESVANELNREEKTDKGISQSNDEAPLCPKCNIKMIKRKAKQGDNAGGQFYGCPNYPNCREIKQI